MKIGDPVYLLEAVVSSLGGLYQRADLFFVLEIQGDSVALGVLPDGAPCLKVPASKVSLERPATHFYDFL